MGCARFPLESSYFNHSLHTHLHLLPLPQLFPLFGAKEEKDVSLHSSDATTKYADMAMISDFAALSDDAVVLVTLDAEVPTAIPAAQ